jgi:transposase
LGAGRPHPRWWRPPGDRFGVNLISAVTAKGKLRFAAYDGHLNGPVFIDFCRRLLHDTPGPVVLVLDGHPVHRSKAVKAFAASTDGRLRLCFLPGYAPELNPDEWVWKHVKHDRIGRAGVTGPDDLKAKALAALHRLRSCRIWCRASCGIRTCVTSPPEQSTYIRLGNFAGLRPATNRWHRRYHPLAADGHTSSRGGSTLCWQ